MLALTPYLARIALLALATPAPHVRSLPTLGDPVPATLLKSHPAHRTCDAGAHHRDPCSDLRIHRDRITVAWDPVTHLVTYLYSTTLLTDSELSTGGLGRLDPQMPLIRIHGGFLSPDWCDTDTDLSGQALWCAIMTPTHHPGYGRVVGFVQSSYISVPDLDAPARHVAALPIRIPAPAPAESR